MKKVEEIKITREIIQLMEKHGRKREAVEMRQYLNDLELCTGCTKTGIVVQLWSTRLEDNKKQL